MIDRLIWREGIMEGRKGTRAREERTLLRDDQFTTTVTAHHTTVPTLALREILLTARLGNEVETSARRYNIASFLTVFHRELRLVTWGTLLPAGSALRRAAHAAINGCSLAR